jgi:hypothetical protein
MTAYSTIVFANDSGKGIGAGNICFETISTGTVALTAADTFTYSFPVGSPQGMALKLAQPIVNASGVTAPLSVAITTGTYAYTVVFTTGTVVGSGAATIGCVAYYG